MTLNITLFDKERIFQSSDFRLTGAGKIVTDSSLKAVFMQNSEFDGLLTYTGVGNWKGRDTRDFVIEWLEAAGDVTRTAVAAALAREAEGWISGINRSLGRPQRLTMVLATFGSERGDGQISVISNFEDVRGWTKEPSAEFRISSVSASRHFQALVTGFKPAFNRDARKQLERLARNHTEEPEFIRNAMKDATRRASESPKACGTISPGCTVVCLYCDGRGFQDFSDGSKVDVRYLVRGEALPSMREVLESIGASGAAIRGSTFARASTSRTASPCEARIRGGDDSYDAIILTVPNAGSSTAVGISDTGLVVGTHEELGKAASRFGWRAQLGPSIAGHYEIAQTDVEYITSSPYGVVVGAGTTDEGFVHAFTWEGDSIAPLGDYPGRDCAALNSGPTGLVVGWASLRGDDRAQQYQRPAFWDAAGEITVLGEIPSDWGQAIAASADHALLSLSSGPFDSWGALWDLNRHIHIIGGVDRGRGVYPLGMSADGRILGMTDTSDGMQAVISSAGQNWSAFGTPTGWYPDCISSNGIVAGHVKIDGFERVWVAEPADEIAATVLPHCLYHHCRPCSINALGNVVGWARTDHGSHAVVWLKRE